MIKNPWLKEVTVIKKKPEYNAIIELLNWHGVAMSIKTFHSNRNIFIILVRPNYN